MKTWQETGFTWELTADGSPTLRVNGAGESMHHSGGALEETLMIYGQPLTEVFSSSVPCPDVLSVGLGLGYVELVAAAEAVRTGKSFTMLTFESVEPLVRVFVAWLRDDVSPDSEFQEGLDTVAGLVSEAKGVPATALRETLRLALDEGRWRIEGALVPEPLPATRFHAVLYDVFSAKTSPELWTEEFLKRFLTECSAGDSLFSTYACTGNLKRALKASDFELVQREGFKGKRNSTLGRRGIFRTSPESLAK